MNDIKFPVKFLFRITSLSNDFSATDASGKTIAYVRQKLFRLKEDIVIYADERKAEVIFRIKANQWLDFSAAYSIFDHTGAELGKVARKGWRSIWKAEYELIDQNEQLQYHIREENGWVKVMDGVFGQLPIVGALSGYLFNPTYLVTNLSDQPVMRLKKLPSFFGRSFEIQQLIDADHDDDQRILLGLMMMILLERRRG